MDVRAPRPPLIDVGKPIVAPRLALRLGSAKSDEIAETAS